MEWKTNLTSQDWYTLERIFILIHDTPIEKLIPVVLDNMKEIIPYTHSQICIQDCSISDTEKRYSQKFLYYSSDISNEMLKMYVNKYTEIDYINWYVRDKERRENIFRESDIIANEVRDKSQFAIEWLFVLGIYYGCGMMIGKEQIDYAQIFLYRGKEDGDFTDKELEILKLVRDHLAIRFSNSEYSDLQSGLNSNTSNSKKKLLTKRENEIIDLISDGILRSDLCKVLYVSENTLNKHLANIYRKFSINSFEQLLQLLNKEERNI